MTDRTERFDGVVVLGPKRRVFIPTPFDPDEVWGAKAHHHVSGTVNGYGVRAVVEPMGTGSNAGWGISIGPKGREGRSIEVGQSVAVVLAPEGVQRDELADDLRLALEAEPTAGEFFDQLAQFYRNAYLRWIDATKRRPVVRAERIAEVVALLEAGQKERPRPAAP